jgi:hypothetical protein
VYLGWGTAKAVSGVLGDCEGCVWCIGGLQRLCLVYLGWGTAKPLYDGAVAANNTMEL